MTGINISDSTAKDIVGVGKAASKMSSDMINAKMRGSQNNIMSSASNGERSNTLMNLWVFQKLDIHCL